MVRLAVCSGCEARIGRDRDHDHGQIAPNFLRKLLRYGVTGGVAAVVDSGGFVLLVDANLSIVIASCISFFIAAIVNYNLTSRFVFSSEATPRAFAQFLAAALIGLSVNIVVTFIGVFVLTLPLLAAKIMGIATAFIVNFLINSRFVFRRSLPVNNA